MPRTDAPDRRAGTPRLRRTRYLAAITFAVALLATACGGGSDSSTGDAGGSGTTSASGGGSGEVETVSLTLGTVESITNLPVVVGLAKGYFADEGIDLTVEYMNSGVNIVPALASGQIDIGEGSITPGSFNSFGREINAPIVAYKAGCAAGYDFCPLVIGEGLAETFTDWTDIRGKTVAISARWTASHQKLVEMDEAFGVSADEYTLTELPFADMTQALGSGAIDAAIVIEPIATNLEIQGIGTRVLEEEMEPSVPVTLTSYSEELAADTSPTSAGVRYQMGFIRAVRDIIAARDAFDEGDKTLWNELTELPDVAAAYPVLANPETRDLVSIPLILAEPYVSEDVYNTVRDFYLSGDQLTTEGEAVTFPELVNSTFVDEALKALD